MSDLIRREDVLNAFNRLCDICGKKTENNGAMCRACSLDDAIDIVEDIPNAETTGALDDAIQEYIKDGYILAEPKVGKWIPCEERLPQEYGKYLTTIESLLEEFSNGIDIIYYGKFTTSDDKEKVGWHYVDEWGEWEVTHVIAWQPLLEPYEMERSE